MQHTTAVFPSHGLHLDKGGAALHLDRDGAARHVDKGGAVLMLL